MLTARKQPFQLQALIAGSSLYQLVKSVGASIANRIIGQVPYHLEYQPFYNFETIHHLAR